ncbi:TadE/TadG family type IV pilus assembly protein [Microbacterium maritypicum]|uniref:TadE/TadG family type IV pilus assembly protein n=1 Tax=Microbacterium maritypicum TaxID=33918 RepID=UPI003A8CBC4D
MRSIRNLIRRFRRDEDGSMTPAFLIMVPLFVILVGLVVDGAGKIQANDNTTAIASGASRAAANAVAAGVITDGGVNLDLNRARTTALDYIAAAGMTGTVTVNANEITVSVQTVYDTHFLSIIGVETLPASATATAQLITQ